MTPGVSEREWFERIVEEVIRRLLERGVGVRTEPAANAELVLDEKVITLRTLEDRIAGIRRVVVQPRAVVTPAVKDDLKERGIELVRTKLG